MELDLFDIADVFQNVSSCINFLRGCNLLLQDLLCCNQICSKVRDSSISDKQIFQCKVCAKRQSIRKFSFWTKSKLPLTVLVAVLFFFCQDLSVTQTQKLLKKRISKRGIIQWYTYFRDIMTTYFVNNPVRFTQGCTVYCDETFIGGKRKYNRGRIPAVDPRYLFGIIDNNAHKAFCQFVTKRDHINIIPLITRTVPPGSEIHTDGAAVYQQLQMMNYTHKFVVHKREYVAQDGTHSNWIENFWANLKIKLKSIRGTQGRMLDGFIDEYVYRYNRKNEGNLFNLMLQDIAIFYPI